MANEMILKKENLREIDWVKEQTKSALSDLHKEVLYTKDGDDVKFDVETSLNYLQTLKDKKTWREMVSQNSGATIMAIQILLKNKGYDVGKIDGILRAKGQATSRTMEAIRKFQRDNGLKDDGVPGPNTLKKILELYGTGGGTGGGSGGGAETVEEEEVKDITEEEYERLCKKASLTDDEIKQVVKYANDEGKDSLILSGLTSITDKQAEELSKVKYLYLEGLTSITDKQAEELSKVADLTLDGLTSITDKQAEELSKVWMLSLSGLTSITDKQAEELSKVDFLSLNGLTSITDKQATELAKLGSHLGINDAILTPAQKTILGR